MRFHWFEFIDRDGDRRVVVYFPDANRFEDMGTPLPWSL